MSLPVWAQLLGLIGTTLVIVRGRLFEPLRKRAALARCAQCLGWWVGLVGGLAVTPRVHGPIDWLENAALMGGMVSPLAMAADAAIAWLDAKAFDAERKS